MTSPDTGPVQVYSAGFAFDDRGRVVLLEKRTPAWQAGKLNAVGGKVEPGEHPREAMVREFFEETCLLIENWQELLTLEGTFGRVHFFRTRVDHDTLEKVYSGTEEPVDIYDVDVVLADAHLPVIDNVRWLLPLAAYAAETYAPFTVVDAAS